jgi:hypothetical protein
MAKSSNKKQKAKRTPLQVAGASFVDQLGKAAVNKLKDKLGLNTEVKSVDYSTSVATTNTLAVLSSDASNPIAQGTTDSTRNGSTVRVTRFEMNGCVVNGAANLDPNSMVRVLGVRFRPTPGAFTSSANALASVLYNAGVTGFPELLSPTTIPQDQAYKNDIIFDESFALGATGTFPTGQFFRRDYRPEDLHLEWTAADTTGSTANSIGERIVWYAVCSQATASNFPIIKLSQRLYFVDN